jgi:hypothetical protein
MKKASRVLITIFTFLLMQLISKAQPFNLNDRIKPVELEFRRFNPKDSIKQGKISIASVQQTEDTMYFFAKGISIYSAVYVSVTGNNSCPDLKISLHTDNWHKADQSGTTNEKKHWETKFKTEGDFGIMVVGPPQISKYAIIVWNGKDVRPDMPSPFKTKGKSSGGGGIFSGKNLLIGGIVLLLIIIGFLLYKLKNK